jgi:hypothetical protein
LTSFDYNATKVLSEYGVEGNISPLTKFDYTNRYKMNGTGYNFKVGVTAVPFVNSDIDALAGLRIGAAMHTPTFWNITDVYQPEMATYFSDYPSVNANRLYYPQSLDANEIKYALETPTKTMVGLAYVWSGESAWRGILSVDYEHVNYSKIKMRETSDYVYDFSDENLYIANDYKTASNVRLGGELGYNSYSFRAGYARYDNPYVSALDNNGAVQMISAGLGFKISSSCTMDFTYTRAMQSDKAELYTGSDVATYKITQHNFLLTLGWRY